MRMILSLHLFTAQNKKMTLPITHTLVFAAVLSYGMVTAALYFDVFITPMKFFEDGQRWQFHSTKDHIMWILFIIHLGGPLFIMLQYVAVSASNLLMTQSQLSRMFGAVLAFHVMLWIRMFTPTYVIVWVWIAALVYWIATSTPPAPIAIAILFQSVLLTLSRYDYFIRLEKVARANPYHEMFSIMPGILSCALWIFFSCDMSIDWNLTKLNEHMHNVEYFAGPAVQYTAAMALQGYGPSSMYPLVTAVKILNETQAKIPANMARCARVKQYFDSGTSDSKALTTTEVTGLLAKAIDVTGLLAKVEKVTVDSDYNARLSQARVVLMSDPQYSTQLQAYRIEKHTKALKENTSATEANTTAHWVNLFAPRRR